MKLCYARLVIKLSHFLLGISSAVNILIYSYKVIIIITIIFLLCRKLCNYDNNDFHGGKLTYNDKPRIFQQLRQHLTNKTVYDQMWCNECLEFQIFPKMSQRFSVKEKSLKAQASMSQSVTNIKPWWKQMFKYI